MFRCGKGIYGNLCRGEGGNRGKVCLGVERV